MKLILTNPPNQTIPMSQMRPGQFAWCESHQSIVFATWKANEPCPAENAFVALNDEGSTWMHGINIPVQLLPPGTQFTLKA